MHDQKSIIAISTSYDALAISPELSIALENSASGLLGSLELSRIFSKLSLDLQQVNRFKFDLLFILTPTGSMNFEATSKFIDHLQSNIKERIKLVLCLDSLSNLVSDTTDLNLYVGQGTDDDAASNQFIKEFKKASAKKNVFVTENYSPSVNPMAKRFIQFEH